jgi:hypothetical protein
LTMNGAGREAHERGSHEKGAMQTSH